MRDMAERFFGVPSLSPVDRKSEFKCLPLMVEIAVSRSTGARRENNDMGNNSQVVQLLQHEGWIPCWGLFCQVAKN